MGCHAHSLTGKDENEWQSLDAHLRGVSALAGEFASDFGASEWGRLVGRWHDVGKYSNEFQAYLRLENGFEAHMENIPGKVDHSTAGAQHAVKEIGLLGHLLAYTIAGHHSGLLDGLSEYACQDSRLKKKIPDWHAAPDEIAGSIELELPAFLKTALGRKDGFTVSFFVRMLFSCLVDADYLDTERFMEPKKSMLRLNQPKDILVRMEEALSIYAAKFRMDEAPVNKDREYVRQACLEAANEASGFFSLTVPTGGGKTLSSLAFALRHARLHGLKKVIYVLPFTTIIEQNAEEFRKVMAYIRDIPSDQLVVEHHSNFDPDKETPVSRLACENWDAPLIVTTSVQFYESLFNNRSSACRKLHNLVRSVIIIDEAQAIPVDYLNPVLKALKELSNNYGSSIVLCTATQPAVEKRQNFPIGISDVREIIPKPKELYDRLERVKVKDLGRLADSELAAKLLDEKQVLCIVNTRRHARLLSEAIDGKESEGSFHLSALMCPAHRSEVLEEIRQRLAQKLECRVVSTQLIEAGVDVDFPVVYRSMAGLDSIAQAAGRCNRNGRMKGMGRTFIFRSEHEDKERFLADTAECAAQILDLYKGDPLDLSSIEHYFKLYYWDQSARWDSKQILASFNLVQEQAFPFLFNFASVAGLFHIIEENTRPVVIPWGEKGRQLRDRLLKMPVLDRATARSMQRYTVQIQKRLWMEQLSERNIEPLFDGSSAILVGPGMHYSDKYGLNFYKCSGNAFFG